MVNNVGDQLWEKDCESVMSKVGGPIGELEGSNVVESIGDNVANEVGITSP